MPEMLEILNWTGMLTGIVAAVLVAGRFGDTPTGIGFVVFVICSLSWVGAGLLDADYELAVLNAVLTAVNGLGVWRWLIRPKLLDKPAG